MNFYVGSCCFFSSFNIFILLCSYFQEYAGVIFIVLTNIAYTYTYFMNKCQLFLFSLGSFSMAFSVQCFFLFIYHLLHNNETRKKWRKNKMICYHHVYSNVLALKAVIYNQTYAYLGLSDLQMLVYKPHFFMYSYFSSFYVFREIADKCFTYSDALSYLTKKN